MNKIRPVPQVGSYIYSMNESLLEIETRFKRMFREGAVKLRNFNPMISFDDLDNPDSISLNDLIDLSKKLKRYSSMGDIYSQAQTAFWIYFEVHRAYMICFKEGYGPFLSHARRLECLVKKNPGLFTKKKTLYNENFQEIVRLVKEKIDQHPKLIDLKERIFIPKHSGMQKIIFAKESSAYWLRYMLLKSGVNTELILDERKKDRQRTVRLVGELLGGKLQALIVTFTPKKSLGLHYPMIIHYQIPERKESRVIRNDSIGALPAYIYYIFLDHGIERRFYFLTSDMPRKKKVNRKGEIPFDEFMTA
jgi:hypothetical protein